MARFMAFMEDVESGRGMVREQMRRGELKKLRSSESIWEYRVKDNATKRLLRIYLGVFEKAKIIVVLHVHFKSDQKAQRREIRVAEERLRRFEARRWQKR